MERYLSKNFHVKDIHEIKKKLLRNVHLPASLLWDVAPFLTEDINSKNLHLNYDCKKSVSILLFRF